MTDRAGCDCDNCLCGLSAVAAGPATWTAPLVDYEKIREIIREELSKMRKEVE